MTNKELSEYIFLNDTDQSADVALVFGTWNAWKGSVEKAAELYRTGLVPKIIVSGGINAQTGIIEGDHMANELINLGVKRDDILIENESTNTLENVLFSLKVIDKEIGLKSIHTIVGVVKNYHARRSLMTLRRHTPANIKLKAAAYYSEYYPFTKDNWAESESGKKNVLEEIEKIKTYLAKSDIAELN